MSARRNPVEPDRELAQRAGRHGTAAPRGQDAVAGARGGRFGRMFPDLPPCKLSDETIDDLVGILKGRPQPNRAIPAGYTYLGQFVDHDLTFDPLTVLQREQDPHALVNFRTPRFDLDCLYGSGPVQQPFLYDWRCELHPGVKLLVGHNPPDCDLAEIDLPRNEQGRALLGDARNDENLIVAQLHLLFIHFHNKVVDRIGRRCPEIAASDLFTAAQRCVRWHYQWIVMHDFLRRIIGTSAHAALSARIDAIAPGVETWLSGWRDEPFMPLEFSAAAYRFGHSMVNIGYRPKRSPPTAFPIFRPHDATGLQWAGSQRLPCALEIDWSLFFFRDPDLLDEHTNHSLLIDPSIAGPLYRLPPDDAELPRLNLRRSRALELPSGADVARAMSITPLAATDLRLDNRRTPAAVPALAPMLETLPLWVYILLEAWAKGNGHHLGPVGGAIVSEVLLGLLEADPSSYLHHRGGWTPELAEREDGDFTMRDLVRYVEDPTWL